MTFEAAELDAAREKIEIGEELRKVYAAGTSVHLSMRRVLADPFAPGVTEFHELHIRSAVLDRQKEQSLILRCRKFGARVCASRRLRDFHVALLRPAP